MDFPPEKEVQWLKLCNSNDRVQIVSLSRELRSHMPHVMAKKEKNLHLCLSYTQNISTCVTTQFLNKAMCIHWYSMLKVSSANRGSWSKRIDLEPSYFQCDLYSCSFSWNISKQGTGRMGEKGESRDGARKEVAALERQSCSGLPRRRQGLFWSWFHISTVTRDKTATEPS